MNESLDYLSVVEDTRQKGKVRHQLSNIVILTLFASLGNAEHWMKLRPLESIRVRFEAIHSFGEWYPFS